MIIFNRQNIDEIRGFHADSMGLYLTLRNLWASYATIHKKSEFLEKY
jgi:hypothetical protein